MTIFDQFMPSGASAPAPKPTSPPKPKGNAKPKGAPPDAESTPERQLARRLGDYGAAVLRDQIKVKYEDQRAVWNKHIDKVVTAFSIALGQQAETLKKDEQQRKASAEFTLFIFSLVSGGVMRWAGAYVQYKLYPALFSKAKDKLINFTDTNWPKDVVPAVAKVTEVDYDKLMASFVGGMVQDVGNRSTAYGGKTSGGSPYGGMADDDPRSLVRIIELSLKDALQDGTKVVTQQMDDAVFWMEQSPDFGNAWAAKTGGSESSARDQIRVSLQKLRDGWARNWPYFGQNPKPFTQSVLAEEFERALWAGALEDYFSQAAKKAGFTFDDVMTKKIDATLARKTRSPILLDEPTAVMTHVLHSMDVDSEILSKLRKLNVLRGKTSLEQANQHIRSAKGEAPDPTADVGYATASFGEIRALWGWAHGYPRQAAEIVKKAGSEGVARTLEPIPKY